MTKRKVFKAVAICLSMMIVSFGCLQVLNDGTNVSKAVIEVGEDLPNNADEAKVLDKREDLIIIEKKIFELPSNGFSSTKNLTYISNKEKEEEQEIEYCFAYNKTTNMMEMIITDVNGEIWEYNLDYSLNVDNVDKIDDIVEYLQEEDKFNGNIAKSFGYDYYETYSGGDALEACAKYLGLTAGAILAMQSSILLLNLPVVNVVAAIPLVTTFITSLVGCCVNSYNSVAALVYYCFNGSFRVHKFGWWIFNFEVVVG